MDGSFDGDRILIQRLTGTVAGGKLRGGGSIKIGAEASPQFWLSARGLGLNYPQDLRTALNADFRLIVENGSPRLSGQIDLFHCILTRNITPTERNLNTFLLTR